MSSKITIRIEEIEGQLDQIRTGAENIATIISDDEMAPNKLSVTNKMQTVNQDIQKVLEQYKVLILNNINSTRHSAHEMAKADTKIAQDISSSAR